MDATSNTEDSILSEAGQNEAAAKAVSAFRIQRAESVGEKRVVLTGNTTKVYGTGDEANTVVAYRVEVNGLALDLPVTLVALEEIPKPLDEATNLAEVSSQALDWLFHSGTVGYGGHIGMTGSAMPKNPIRIAGGEDDQYPYVNFDTEGKLGWYNVADQKRTIEDPYKSMALAAGWGGTVNEAVKELLDLGYVFQPNAVWNDATGKWRLPGQPEDTRPPRNSDTPKGMYSFGSGKPPEFSPYGKNIKPDEREDHKEFVLDAKESAAELDEQKVAKAGDKLSQKLQDALNRHAQAKRGSIIPEDAEQAPEPEAVDETYTLILPSDTPILIHSEPEGEDADALNPYSEANRQKIVDFEAEDAEFKENPWVPSDEEAEAFSQALDNALAAENRLQVYNYGVPISDAALLKATEIEVPDEVVQHAPPEPDTDDDPGMDHLTTMD